VLGGIEGFNPRFRLLITILVGTKIKFKVAENEQLTGYLSMMLMMNNNRVRRQPVPGC
jgi:hypothetical protein